MALVIRKVGARIVHEEVRISDIDIHPALRRPAGSGGEEISIVIRNARGAKFRTADRRLVVSGPCAQRQILARVPFKPDGITRRVLIINVEHVRGRAGIRKNNRHILQAAPPRPGDVPHDRKLPRKPLVNAEVENVWQIQRRARALVEEDVLERGRRGELHGRASRSDQRDAAEGGVTFQRMIDRRAVTETDAAILQKSRLIVGFAIFEQRPKGETDTPIIARDFRDAIKAAGNEPSIRVCLSRRGDGAGNRRGRDAAGSENRGQRGEKLRER